MTVECFSQSGSSPPPADCQVAVREAAAELYHRRVTLLRRRLGLTADEAQEVVSAGTIRALSTPSLPTVPTITWFHAVDRSAFLDERRRVARAQAASGAMTAWQVIEDEATLPAKGKGINDEYDRDEAAYGDHQQQRHEAVRLPGDDYREPRYLPAPPPHVDLGRPGDDLAEVDLTILADRAGVSAEDVELLIRNLAGESWANIAKGMGIRRATIRERATRALARLQDAARNGR